MGGRDEVYPRSTQPILHHSILREADTQRPISSSTSWNQDVCEGCFWEVRSVALDAMAQDASDESNA